MGGVWGGVWGGGGRRGAEAALVSRGTTVPLSPTKSAFTVAWSKQHVPNPLLKLKTSAYTPRQYHPAHLLSLWFVATPAPHARPPPHLFFGGFLIHLPFKSMQTGVFCDGVGRPQF